MKVKLLSTALEDLYEARLFYERQGEGLGEYFFDSLFSDIDSLILMLGVTRKYLVIIECWPKGFLTQFITRLNKRLQLCGEF